MIVLLRGEAMRYNISVRTEHAVDLPPVIGDRVQFIDAMKDVDVARELSSTRSERKTRKLWCPSLIAALGCPHSRRTRSSTRSWPPNLTATAWDFGSAAPSANRMAVACWLPTTFQRGASFFLTLPTKVETHE